MRDQRNESVYHLLNQLNEQWSMQVRPEDVFKNEFLHDLKTDHIAVDERGVPIARATDRASLTRAAPGAAAYFSADDLKDILPIPSTPPSKIPVPKAPFAAPVAPTPEPVKVMPVGTDFEDTPRPDWDKERPDNLHPAGTLADLMKQTPSGTVDATSKTFQYSTPENLKAWTPDAVVNTPLAQLPTTPYPRPTPPAATLGQPDNRASAENVDAGVTTNDPHVVDPAKPKLN